MKSRYGSKTECLQCGYSVDRPPGGAFSCPLCGLVWAVTKGIMDYWKDFGKQGCRREVPEGCLAVFSWVEL